MRDDVAMDDTDLLWATAIGSVATALFTAFLWLVAWRTLSGARKQLSLLRAQAEREGRPYVTADVVPGLHGAGNWDLIVANTGRTAARDITFDFDDWAPKDSEDHITSSLLAYLRASHVLVPNARHRLHWRMNPDPQFGTTEAGADPSSRLTIKYADDQGQKYTDAFSFDVDLLGAASPVPTEGPKAIGKDKDLARINQAIRTLSVHVGELRR